MERRCEGTHFPKEEEKEEVRECGQEGSGRRGDDQGRGSSRDEE